jgi:hypothetical protein
MQILLVASGLFKLNSYTQKRASSPIKQFIKVSSTLRNRFSKATVVEKFSLCFSWSFQQL